jgi:hypothetical protein
VADQTLRHRIARRICDLHSTSKPVYVIGNTAADAAMTVLDELTAAEVEALLESARNREQEAVNA